MKLLNKIRVNGITTAWEENYSLCRKFKGKYKKAPTYVKLIKLIELSSYELKLPAYRDNYLKNRARKHGIRKKCWVCGAKAFYQHHIILLKNGGFDNGINRIPICDGCHKEIHPWLN